VEIWQRAFASMKRLDDILTRQSEINDSEADFSITEVKGDIVFKDVNFTYPSNEYPGKNKPALTKFDLTIKQGSTIGIIGSIGSGKSSIISLLLRMYKLEIGKLIVGGHDINKIPVKTLRNLIGYADSFMFADTIMENIKLFDTSISDETAKNAAKLAGVYDNIMDLPKQFETEIGERGITLSGGQKQRIGIARAIAKNPDILILDDSLSAVDTQTEEEILSHLRGVLVNRTGIIIAHRVSAVKHADTIIFMDKGRIAEQGSHEQLLALKGEYYRLNLLQSLESNIGETL
jgi:ATP-binding cassette subfamily B protein